MLTRLCGACVKVERGGDEEGAWRGVFGVSAAGATEGNAGGRGAEVLRRVLLRSVCSAAEGLDEVQGGEVEARSDRGCLREGGVEGPGIWHGVRLRGTRCGWVTAVQGERARADGGVS